MLMNVAFDQQQKLLRAVSARFFCVILTFWLAVLAGFCRVCHA
jgi:hypothetical protein